MKSKSSGLSHSLARIKKQTDKSITKALRPKNLEKGGKSIAAGLHHAGYVSPTALKSASPLIKNLASANHLLQGGLHSWSQNHHDLQRTTNYNSPQTKKFHSAAAKYHKGQVARHASMFAQLQGMK